MCWPAVARGGALRVVVSTGGFKASAPGGAFTPVPRSWQISLSKMKSMTLLVCHDIVHDITLYMVRGSSHRLLALPPRLLVPAH